MHLSPEALFGLVVHFRRRRHTIVATFGLSKSIFVLIFADKQVVEGDAMEVRDGVAAGTKADAEATRAAIPAARASMLEVAGNANTSSWRHAACFVFVLWRTSCLLMCQRIFGTST